MINIKTDLIRIEKGSSVDKVRRMKHTINENFISAEVTMDNNKNRMKDREKSNAELRKMYPKDGADIGIIDGEKIGAHANGKNHGHKKEPSY